MNVNLSVFGKEERQHSPSVSEIATSGDWGSVVDFCYLSNKYFPTRAILDQLSHDLEHLVKTYPSMQNKQVGLVNQLTGMNSEYVAVGNGASELIQIAVKAFGKKYIMPFPSYMEYENVMLDNKKQVCYLPYVESNGFNLDVDALIKLARAEKADAVVLPNPNSPTGAITSREDLFRLLKELSHFDMILIDESFIEFSNEDRTKIPTLLPHLAKYPNLIVMRSMGKDYGACGIRIGFVATAHRTRLEAIRRELPIWNVSPLAERFMQLVAKSPNEYEQARIRCIRATQQLYRDLSAMPQLEVFPTYSNFVLFKMLGPQNSTFVRDELLKRHGFYVRDCKSKRGLSDKFIRVGAHTEENNAKLVAALKEILAN
ncbi:MAG: histidinol-phosphate aminotransferase family protein [Verrucomicrobiae bacterium]|nr:histidinol-phosphate aminotransferase family protein [Verrucomicrobiae bacterium]